MQVSARPPGGAGPSAAADAGGWTGAGGRHEPEAAAPTAPTAAPADEFDERPVTVRIPREGTDALSRILKRPADSSSALAQRQIKISSANAPAATVQKPAVAPATPASASKKLTLNERFSKLPKAPTPAATGDAKSDARPTVVQLGGPEGGQRKRPSSGAADHMGSHSSLEVGPSNEDAALPYIGVLKRPRIIATPRSKPASNQNPAFTAGVSSPGVIRLGTVRNVVNSINQRKLADERVHVEPGERIVHINSEGVLAGGSSTRVRPFEGRLGGGSPPRRAPKTPLGGRLGLSPSARRELAHNLQQVSSPRQRLGGASGGGVSSAPESARYDSSITIGRLNVLHGADGSVRTIKLAGSGGDGAPMSATSSAAARLRARARVSFGGVTAFSPRSPASSSIRRRLGNQRMSGGSQTPLAGRLGDSFSRNHFK